MVRFLHSTAHNAFEADIVIIGVPDESRSHATRKGASKGPDTLRYVSNGSEFFERDGKVIPICPLLGRIDNKHIFDYGNTPRENLHKLISDLVSSTTNYYGSVLTDSYQWIDFTKSLLIGTRAAEREELENAARVGLEVITPVNITELGISQIADKVRSKNCSNKKYISIDLDCLDPAHAPGVSLPTPCGLSSIELIYLIKLAINSGIIGIDLVELSPDFDFNNMTAHLAARILLESIASMNISNGKI